ncbi:ABC transporter ATP-binding protein [Rickettsiales endosymbiont of Stachyamoeba lipophora]|uniref:ABC transporter ATP-binding protein n=1 Tax=Rickettsiales endosymbiont of Stachyamoeba lipophora TaxID=2486578 RepID=UPI000F64A94C|nr:ABC transporter ATP-binding protein [Rickettsiales endosymbiont of Stachyamoeba lipophora]AZL16330.1 ABC transporter ATP-binding protein [Rickettsiales endosymbiont of Stachyamoeba lipophora]
MQELLFRYFKPSSILTSLNLTDNISRFIWSLLKQYKAGISFMVFTAIIFAVDITARPYFIKIIIDAVNLNTEGAKYLNILLKPIAVYIAILCIANLFYRCWDMVCLKVFPEMKAKIIYSLVDYTHVHSYEYFQNNFAGSISNKIVNDVTNSIENIIQSLINGMLPYSLVFVFGLAILTSTHKYFGIVFFIWSLCYFIMYIKLNSQIKSRSNIFAYSRSKLVGSLVDSLNNAINVKLFSSKKYELDFLSRNILDVEEKEKQLHFATFIRCLFSSISIIILSIIMLSLLIYTKNLNLITSGDFALVITLSFSIMEVLQTLSKNYLIYSKEIGICKQALSALMTPYDIKDSPNSTVLKVAKGEIIFENISFSYNKDTTLFVNQSLIINPGQKIGLIGYSGSGKTTLVNLIMRLYELKHGRILIDKQDISVVTQDSLRRNIGFIPQDPVLFNRTVLENVRYARPEASEKEIIEACKKAKADEFIREMPDGYNSMVGDRGVKLSGGQRQRIAIARAILKNSPILILDEATSALDSITELSIEENLKEIMQDKTTLVIAHRLSTLLSMDRILVFNNGQIIEDGSHQELLANNGLYKVLWDTQVGGFLNEKES